MRILSVGNLFPPAATGGYERIWSDGIDALHAAGHAVSVLTTAPVAGALLPDGWTDPDWVTRSLPWFWRDHAWLRPSASVQRRAVALLEDELERVRPDVVSWWSLGGLPLGIVEAVRRRGIPAVGVVADGWMVYGPRVRRSKLDLSGAAEWVCISEAVRSGSIRAAGGLARTSIAHPGVDPDAFPASPAPDWTGRLLVCGRVEPPKGVEFAIRALAAQPAGTPTGDAPASIRDSGRWTLTIDGGGPAEHRADLEALAARLGVAERVRWQRSAPGKLADVHATHDCVLFPVVWDEPWGLVPLEAMAVGRPVVACVGGGTAEYLTDDANGLAVPPRDGAALAAAVARLEADAALRADLVAAGRATAARFTRAAFDAAVVAAHERATRR